MEKIVWQDVWSVGVKKIDLQHRSFIDLYNTFVEAYEEGESHDFLYPTLKNMLDYLKNHFEEEESWMLKVGYADYAAHLKEHRHFIEQTNDFVSRYLDGDYTDADEPCYFLHDWFINHIKGTDLNYVPAIKSWLERHPGDSL